MGPFPDVSGALTVISLCVVCGTCGDPGGGCYATAFQNYADSSGSCGSQPPSSCPAGTATATPIPMSWAVQA